MAKTFTFQRAGHGGFRISWAIALSAALIAAAAPAVACEKSPSRWIAGPENPQQSVATFTGEFVNGAPVYRLPAITVVTRREMEIARTQRDDAHARPTRPRPDPRATAPMPAGKGTSASRQAITVMPCVG